MLIAQMITGIAGTKQKNHDAMRYIATLCDYAQNHRAVDHVYLQSLQEGQYSNMNAVLQDFAYQYAFYSEHFTDYLRNVIWSLSSHSHKKRLLENLQEEEGEDNENCVSHKELFVRFQAALGVNESFKQANQPCEGAKNWQKQFMKLVKTGNEAKGIGAIGLGTEFIMPTVYSKILASVQRHTNLSEQEYIFLPLHCEADEEHGETLCEIAYELAKKEDNRIALRQGMAAALNLRAAFWDAMHQRALSFEASK